MEFFLPSLIIVILGGLIAFYVLPRFSPLVLALISIALLIFGVYHHMKIFGYEYTYSTWQDIFKGGAYAPAVMIAFLMIFIIFYFMYLFGSTGAPKNNAVSALSNNISELPSAESATNPLTEVINNTIRSVNNVFNGNGNAKNKKNNGGLLEEATNSIVNTFSNVKSLIEGPAPTNNKAV
jgi:magnesium-transporting ATPase (P-type)